jgi:hypothetical protein
MESIIVGIACVVIGYFIGKTTKQTDQVLMTATVKAAVERGFKTLQGWYSEHEKYTCNRDCGRRRTSSDYAKEQDKRVDEGMAPKEKPLTCATCNTKLITSYILTHAGETFCDEKCRELHIAMMKANTEAAESAKNPNHESTVKALEESIKDAKGKPFNFPNDPQ